MSGIASPAPCPSCGAIESGPFCRMCGAELYREDDAGPATQMAQALAARVRERASYAFSTMRTRSTARSEVLARRAQLDRIGEEIRATTYALGEAALRDDSAAVEQLRGSVARLDDEAARVRGQIEQVVRWASGAVERERLAVQQTHVERPGVAPHR